MNIAAFADRLAMVNAAMNLSSALLLLAGLRFIWRKDIRNHQRCMLGAAASSALFLVLYLVRFALTGSHSFTGPDFVRTIYLVILFTHMVLAVAVVPMVLRVLYLARRKRFAEHRRLARWTFPIWLYVSMTGLMVYVMLYHIYR